MASPSPLLDSSWHRVLQLRSDKPAASTLIAENLWQDEETQQGEILGVESLADVYDGRWEYEDEEELVTLDVGDLASLGSYVTSAESYSVSGLETGEPYLRMGNVTFRGIWDELSGSLILLKNEREGQERTMLPFISERTGQSVPSSHQILFRPVVPIDPKDEDRKRSTETDGRAKDKKLASIGKQRGRKPATEEEKVRGGIMDALKKLYGAPGPFEKGPNGVLKKAAAAEAQIGSEIEMDEDDDIETPPMPSGDEEIEPVQPGRGRGSGRGRSRARGRGRGRGRGHG